MLYFTKVYKFKSIFTVFKDYENSFVSDASICCSVNKLREILTDVKSLIYDKIMIYKIAK